MGRGYGVQRVRASDEVFGQAMSTHVSAPSRAAARAPSRLRRLAWIAISPAGFAEEEEHDQAQQSPPGGDCSRR